MIKQKFSMIGLVGIFIFLSNGLAQQAQPTGLPKPTRVKLDSTIWKYLSATDRSQWTITKSDSENALKNYFIPGYNIYKAANETWDKVIKKMLPLEQEASNLIGLLEQVKDYFEEGLKLNPFDNYLRTGIFPTYSRLENLYAAQKEPLKRLQMLYNLLCLKKDPRDRLYYYQNIGMIFRQLELWELARDNYHLAVKAIFEGDESGIDSTKLFENLYWRGYAQFRLYEDEPARTSFIYARMIAPDENSYNNLTALINFIDWDAGNIRASEKYNEARRLSNEKNTMKPRSFS